MNKLTKYYKRILALTMTLIIMSCNISTSPQPVLAAEGNEASGSGGAAGWGSAGDGTDLPGDYLYRQPIGCVIPLL